MSEPEPEPVPVIDTTIDIAMPTEPPARTPEPPTPEPDTAPVDGVALWLQQMHAKRARDRWRMLRGW
jgi:hypothetical protein